MSIPQTCTSATLVGVLGKAERTINGIRRAGGMPLKDGGIDLWALIRAGAAAYRARQREAAGVVSVDEARIRHLTAQAEARELLNARMRGELVAGEDMRDAVGALVTAARAQFLAVPTVAAGRLVGETDPNVIRDVLTTEIHAALAKLADGDAASAVFTLARERSGSEEGESVDVHEAQRGNP